MYVRLVRTFSALHTEAHAASLQPFFDAAQKAHLDLKIQKEEWKLGLVRGSLEGSSDSNSNEKSRWSAAKASRRKELRSRSMFIQCLF